ncbi:MAG: tetratricopeptide repeat protein [Planctomycetota bacterium]
MTFATSRRFLIAAAAFLSVAMLLAFWQVPAVAATDPTTQQKISNARFNLEKGAFDTALASAREAKNLDPENIDALTIHAEITSIWQPKRYKKEREETIKELQRLKTGGELPELIQIGDNIVKKEYDKVIEATRKLLQANPESDRKSLYLLLMAYGYGGKGEANKAVRHLQAAIGWRKGEFIQAYVDLANYYIGQNNLNDARVMLSKAQRLDSRNPRWVVLTQEFSLSLDERYRDPVIRNMSAAVKNWKSPPIAPDILSNAYYVLGQACFMRDQKGDKEKGIKADRELAIEAFENAAKDEFHTSSLMFLTRLYASEGEFDKAIAHCNEALKRDPENRVAQYSLGLIYIMKKSPDFAKAGEVFKKILDNDGKQHEISLIGLGHTALLKGDAAGAYKSYSDLLKRREEEGMGEWPLVQLFAAHASIAAGNNDQARKHLEEIEQLQPSVALDADGYLKALGSSKPEDLTGFHRALILFQEGLYDLAKDEWKAVLAVTPQNLIARHYLFLTYLTKEEGMEPARKEAESLKAGYAERFNGKNPSGEFARIQIITTDMGRETKVEGRRKKREELIAAYSKIKTAYPDRPEAYRALARLYLDRGEDDTAKQIAEEALKREKFATDITLFNVRVEALGRLGQTDSAVEAHEEFIEKLIENGEYDKIIGLRYTLAAYHNSQGNTQKAIENIKRIEEAIKEISKGATDPEKKEKQLRKANINAIDMLRRLGINSGEVNLGLEANRMLREIDNEWPGLDFTEGLDRFDRKEWDEAIVAFQKEIKHDRLDAYHVMAEAGKGLAMLRLKGPTADVVRAYETAANLSEYLSKQSTELTGNPNAGTQYKNMKDQVMFYKACARLAAGKMKLAENSLKLCPTLFPAIPGPVIRTTAFDKTSLGTVLKELKSDDNFFELAAGVFNMMRGYQNQAVLHFQNEINTNPKNFIAHYLKGLALLFKPDAESKEQGIDAMKECVALQPGFISAKHQIYGALREKLQNAEDEDKDKIRAEVVEAINNLIALDERYNFELAVYYVSQEEYKKAIEQYHKCAELPYPVLGDGKSDMLNQAAWIAAEHLKTEADLKRAVEDADAAVKEMELQMKRAGANPSRIPLIRERTGSVRDTLGWAYYKLAMATTKEKRGNLKKAQEAFEQAIEDVKNGTGNMNSIPTILSHLGDVLYEMGTKDDKTEALKRYFEADEYPRFSEKSHVQEQIEKLKKEGIVIEEKKDEE